MIPARASTVGLAAFALLFLGADSATAATIGVISTEDSFTSSPGSPSFREAVFTAQSNVPAGFDGCSPGSDGADQIELLSDEYGLTVGGILEQTDQKGDLEVFGSDKLTILPANAHA